MDKPRFVEGERALFLRGIVPALVVAVDTDAAVFPPTDQEERWPPPPLSDWGLLPSRTMTVVDGPGNVGFLVLGVSEPEAIDGLAGWLEDVEATRGALVLASNTFQVPSPTLGSGALYGQPQVRGGFIAVLDRA